LKQFYTTTHGQKNTKLSAEVYIVVVDSVEH